MKFYCSSFLLWSLDLYLSLYFSNESVSHPWLHLGSPLFILLNRVPKQYKRPLQFACFIVETYLSFSTIGVSVRLSDRSLHREEQKKFRQKLSPVGIETRTSGSSGQCLTNWARQESVGQEISEVSFVCFMHHFTCWTLFISRAWSIEHDFIKAMKIPAGNWMLTKLSW